MMLTEAAPDVSLLLVDGTAKNLEALADALAPLGHRLVRATSSPEALPHLHRERFAALLLDVRREGPKPAELLALLRQSELNRRTPLLLLTDAEGDEAGLLSAQEGGPVDSLRRPFRAEALRARVSLFVELFRAREEARVSPERAGQERFQELLLQAPFAIVAWSGPEHVFEFANPSYERLVNKTGLRGLRAHEVFPEIEGQGVFELLDRAYQTGEIQTTQELPVQLNRQGNGTLDACYFTFNVIPLRDPQGHVTGVMQTVLEVTGHVRARQRLQTLAALTGALSGAQTLEQIARGVVEHVHDALDASTSAVYLTPLEGGAMQLSEARGFAEGARVPGRTLALDAALPLADAVRTGEPVFLEDPREARARYPGLGAEDAARREFQSLVALPLKVGSRVVGCIEFSFADPRDLSSERQFLLTLASQCVPALERAQLHETLRASEERYRTLFESIDDGFCLMQLLFDANDRPIDYRFLEANAAFEQHTGLRNAVGRTALELVPTLDESWFRLYGKVALTGETARFENHAPAMERSFEVYASRVGEPALRQVALVFKDITERKRAEAERERLLAQEEAARKEAEEANRLKDDFLSTVSHELRTPLTAMMGWVQVLRSGTLVPEKRERALETIERNARAQAQLIEDLLDVSRIMAGKLRLEVEPVEVSSIVEGALETVRPTADAKGIRLQAAMDSTGHVMGDTHRLGQVVWNLLSNAVKFTPKGGRVQVFVERRDSSVEITVADTGQGIAREFLPYVFERFRQADGSTKRKYGGLGLGLSIVKQLVEMHGGTVTADSAGEDKGATFTVRLPVSVATRREPVLPATHKELAARREIRCPPQLAGLRVLIVDDEADTRELLRTLLEGCHAQVLTASSAAEGLEVLKAQRPDLLVSDIGMPETDGYTFIERVRALRASEGGRTLAVALTAYARVEDRTRILLAGFTTHVPKPVEPVELLAVLASLADRHKGTDPD